MRSCCGASRPLGTRAGDRWGLWVLVRTPWLMSAWYTSEQSHALVPSTGWCRVAAGWWPSPPFGVCCGMGEEGPVVCVWEGGKHAARGCSRVRAIPLLAGCSWAQVKLYFMIGLPGETDADVMGIAETIEWLQRECQSGERLTRAQRAAAGTGSECMAERVFEQRSRVCLLQRWCMCQHGGQVAM